MTNDLVNSARMVFFALDDIVTWAVLYVLSIPREVFLIVPPETLPWVML